MSRAKYGIQFIPSCMSRVKYGIQNIASCMSRAKYSIQYITSCMSRAKYGIQYITSWAHMQIHIQWSDIHSAHNILTMECWILNSPFNMATLDLRHGMRITFGPLISLTKIQKYHFALAQMSVDWLRTLMPLDSRCSSYYACLAFSSSVSQQVHREDHEDSPQSAH